MNETDFSHRAQLIDAERRRLLAALQRVSRAGNAPVARASLVSQIAQLNDRCEELRQKFYPQAALLSVGFGEAVTWSRTGLPRRVWTARERSTHRNRP
jgi:hypothetical protein